MRESFSKVVVDEGIQASRPQAQGFRPQAPVGNTKGTKETSSSCLLWCTSSSTGFSQNSG